VNLHNKVQSVYVRKETLISSKDTGQWLFGLNLSGSG